METFLLTSQIALQFLAGFLSLAIAARVRRSIVPGRLVSITRRLVSRGLAAVVMQSAAFALMGVRRGTALYLELSAESRILNFIDRAGLPYIISLLLVVSTLIAYSCVITVTNGDHDK